MGKLDEISLAIGGLTADTKAIKETLAKHVSDDEQRQKEIMAALAEFREARAEGRGMGKLAGWAWAGVAAIAGAVAASFGGHSLRAH